jgi:hypothetical protein
MKTGKSLKFTQHGKPKINVMLLLMEAQSPCYVVTHEDQPWQEQVVMSMCVYFSYTRKSVTT